MCANQLAIDPAVMAGEICGKDPEALLDNAISLIGEAVQQFYPRDRKQQEAVVKALGKHLNLVAYAVGVAFTSGYERALGDVMAKKIVL